MADRNTMTYVPRILMTSDFGKTNEPYKHDKLEYRQHVPLGDPDHRQRHVPTGSTSIFALTTQLELFGVIFSSGFARVRLCHIRGGACLIAHRAAHFFVCEPHVGYSLANVTGGDGGTGKRPL